jgi:hypothetical protein
MSPGFYTIRPAVAAGELAGIVGSGFLVYISVAQLGADDYGAEGRGLFRPRQRFYRRQVLIPFFKYSHVPLFHPARSYRNR